MPFSPFLVAVVAIRGFLSAALSIPNFGNKVSTILPHRRLVHMTWKGRFVHSVLHYSLACLV